MPFFQPNVGALKAKGDVRRLCEIAKQHDLKWDTRRAAVAALSEMATDEAIPCLLEIATWSIESVEAFREMGSQAEASLVTIARTRPEVVAVLMELAKGWSTDPSPASSRAISACVRVLGALGTDEALDALVGILRLGVSEGAVVAELTRTGGRAIEGLAVALASRDPEVRGEAAAALERAGWRPDDRATTARLLAARRRWGELAALGEEAVPVLTQMAHEDTDAADPALGVLLKIRTPESSEVLVDVLSGFLMKAPRIAVMKELARRRYEAVIPVLVHELEQWTIDDDPELRTAVTGALAVFGDKAVPPLIERLEGHARERASAALRRIGAPAVSALAARFYDGGWLPPSTRSVNAAEVLVAIRPADELLRAQALVATHRFDQAAKLGPVAREPLQEGVERFWSQPEYSLPALKALARIPGYDPAFVDRLARQVERGPDWGPRDAGFLYGERFRAAEAYVQRCRSGQAGEPTNAGAVSAAGGFEKLQHVRREVAGLERTLATEYSIEESFAASDMGAVASRAFRTEKAKLQRRLKALAKEEATLLAQLSPAERSGLDVASVPPVEQPEVAAERERLRALESLEKLRTTRSVAPLVGMLPSPDEAVRERAEQALNELADPAAIAPLHQLLDHEDADVVGSAARSLTRLGDARGSAWVLIDAARRDERNLYDKAARNLERAGPEAVPLLASAAGDESAAVRWSVAHVLGRIRADGSVPVLAELLQDEDESVREVARAGLERIGTEDAQRAIDATIIPR